MTDTDLRELLRAQRPLVERARTGQATGFAVGREHAALMDEIVGQAYAAAVSRVGEVAGIALAGVGGYGRSALALGADLDLRLLYSEASDLRRAEELAEALLYPLWDAGLAVGHQVVTIDDLLGAAREDLPTATSLLDWRFVAGERALSDDLIVRARAGIFSISELPTFLGRLDEAIGPRHERFGGSVYMLEPDVKNGRGALRDLDAAWWAVRARWNVGDFADLVRLGLLVPRQLAAVEEARELLWRLRNALHARAGRRSDRLSFDEQEAIAPLLGYLAEGADADGPALREAVERMMSDFYRAARTVSRFRDLISARAMPALKLHRPSLRDLDAGVQIFDGEITLSDQDLLRTDPAIALRLVAAAVEQGAPLRASARNAIIDMCGDAAWCERLRATPEAAPLFVSLVQSCAETRLKRGTVMRELHDLGLLVAMIPEFQPVVGRVHHDTYHVYTVDVHSVAAVDRLGEIVRGDIVVDEEQDGRWVGSLACRVAAEMAHTRVLFFATLLHDVGKAIGRRDHSERGAEMGRLILARLGFSEADIEEACRLVLHHLSMYVMATRRDLDDPATAEELADLVRDREGLRNLYLLTVADLSTTSPTSMTSWKARMLDELFIATDRRFSEGASPERALADRRREVLDRAPAGVDRQLLERYLAAMPERYLLGNPSREIIAHAAVLERHLRDERSATVAHVEHEDGAALAQVFVIARDRLGLLADIAAALTAARLFVHGAQIYSCQLDGQVLALDVFWVQRSGGGDVSAMVPRVERDLDDVISGRRAADDLARAARGAGRGERTGPHVATEVILDNRASPQHTVVEVFTRDRPGLLFTLAHAIAAEGISIAVAKIATEGTRVVDVFYVSEQEGGKVEGDRAARLRSALLEALTPSPSLSATS